VPFPVLYPVNYLLIYFSSEVQFGQRVALMGIVLKHRGHSLVLGAAGAAAAACFAASRSRIFPIGRTIKKNTTAAIIRKVMITLMKKP